MAVSSIITVIQCVAFVLLFQWPVSKFHKNTAVEALFARVAKSNRPTKMINEAAADHLGYQLITLVDRTALTVQHYIVASSGPPVKGAKRHKTY